MSIHALRSNHFTRLRYWGSIVIVLMVLVARSKAKDLPTLKSSLHMILKYSDAGVMMARWTLNSVPSHACNNVSTPLAKTSKIVKQKY